MKVNVDKSVSGVMAKAGYGGLLRDKDGSWSIGFSGSLGSADVIMAELKAIQTGLWLA